MVLTCVGHWLLGNYFCWHLKTQWQNCQTAAGTLNRLLSQQLSQKSKKQHTTAQLKILKFLITSEKKSEGHDKKTKQKANKHEINRAQYLITESVRLQPGMDEAFSPGEPRICSVVLISTSVECLMENSITSEGISGVSPWGSSASR